MNRATHNDSWVQNPDGTLGYTCSLITGCLLGHDYCFASKLANGRLKKRYLANENTASMTGFQLLGRDKAGYLHPEDDPFYPRFWPDRLVELDRFLTKSREPVGVFLNIMGEWAGDWVPRAWQDAMFELIRRHPRHRIYLLTNCPQNLPRFSPFPDHCYVGVTATDPRAFCEATRALADIEAKVRFVSVEPYLAGPITFPLWVGKFLDWLIIGAQTKPYKPPKIEWVEEIVRAADKAGIPVFLKDNLLELVNYQSPETEFAFNKEGYYRQEMPE